jgi:leucyl aminopeptidase
VPWVHVDLAAAEHKGGLAHVPTEFTGFGVRYAVHLLGDAAGLHDRLQAST